MNLDNFYDSIVHLHYSDVIMTTIASQITSLTIVYSIVYSDAYQRKLHVTGLCVGNSPVTGEFPAQRTSNAENVSIWWRHHVDGDPSLGGRGFFDEVFLEEGKYIQHFRYTNYNSMRMRWNDQRHADGL